MTFSEALKQIEACANVASPMPLYRCNTEVWALKIKDVLPSPTPTIEELDRILNGDGGATDIGAILVVCDSFAPIAVTRAWVAAHAPNPGGYLVQYRDGYAFFSSAETFEKNYIRI